MRDAEEVTQRGVGLWGGRSYDVELVTNTCVWRDVAGTTEREITEWHLLCSDIGRRRFAAEPERSAFLADSFSELQLERLDPPERRRRTRPYQRLVGERLSQVWFVEDYLQLRFPEATLTLAATPGLVRDGHEQVNRGQSGYADELVSLIGSTVDSIDEFLGLGLVIDFSAGIRITTPLTAQPFPEVAEYRGEDQDGWIWIGGDRPWDG